MTETWLVAYDDTPHSNHALEEAARALALPKGKLVLFHVVPWLQGDTENDPVDLAISADNPVAEKARARVQSQLEEVAKETEAAHPGVEVSVDWTPGEVVAGIVGGADEHQADVVVLGTEGLSGFSRLMLGSVAEKVAREGSRPTLLVRGGDKAQAHLPPEKVLVCVALEEKDDPADIAAVEAAVQLAKPSKAEVLLVNVLGPPYVPASGLGFTDEARQAVEEAAEERAKTAADELERLGEVAKDAGLSFSVEVISTSRSVADALHNVADEAKADALVTAIHRRTGFARLFGSTAYRIARGATAPVLLVRPLAGAEEA